MKAVCWNGKNDVRVEKVPDPSILNPRDAIVRVTSAAICGSDLHLYGGHVAGMKRGDILGHEFMGEIVEIGHENGLKRGDRVVVPFAIACGACFFCERGLWSLCDNTNPNAQVLEGMYGQTGSGLFGYSHLYGGYAGGQAEYVRVPLADVSCLQVPEELADDQVLFLGDIFPTGFQAAEQCDIRPGDVVAVWGAGPVGQFAMKSAYMLGAERVIAIDRFPERLDLARRFAGADTIDYETSDVVEALKLETGGRGPDACIDAVGMEAHGHSADALYDMAAQKAKLEMDRAHVLRQAIHACRKGGTLSIAGVYTAWVDRVPMGAAFAKGLTFRMGQTHVQRYMRPLLERVRRGEVDPSQVISHRMPLEQAPAGYRIFQEKKDHCTKVVLQA